MTDLYQEFCEEAVMIGMALEGALTEFTDPLKILMRISENFHADR